MTPLQKEEDLRLLFDEWVKGPRDKELIALLVDYADDGDLIALWERLMEEQRIDDAQIQPEKHAAVIAKVYQNLLESTPELQLKKTPVRMIHARWYAAAAAFFAVLLSAVLWLINNRKVDHPQVVKNIIKNDLLPGKNGAILTLSDGRTVLLDSVANGVIATEKGAAVSLKGERVVYEASAATDQQLTYNTMNTPRGRKFQLTLSDGTKVWLNAASSITYPTHFAGGQRSVSVEGEVYFEVAANKNHPFIVKYPINTGRIKMGQVEVLGTSFSINAYRDESVVKTTLVNGSVRVRSAQSAKVLMPGQQAQVDSTSNIRLIKEADIAMETSWMHGEFNFKYTHLKTVMRQLARWYDLDVVYEKGAPLMKRFGGEIPMDAMISEVLAALEKSGVRFTLEGRKLTILP